MNTEINKNDRMQAGEARELNITELETVSGGTGPTPASAQKSDFANQDADVLKKIHHQVKSDHVGTDHVVKHG